MTDAPTPTAPETDELAVYLIRKYMGGVTDKDGNKMFVVAGNCPMHGETKT